MWFSICRRYAPGGSIERMRVLIVEDEPYLAEAIRDGLRLAAIAADIAGDGDTALQLLSVNAYDIAVLASTAISPAPPATRSRNVSSPPAMACRSSCSPPPTGSTTRSPGSNSAPTTTSRSRSHSRNSCSVSGRSTAGAPTTGRPCERSSACGSIRSAARSTAIAATSRSPGSVRRARGPRRGRRRSRHRRRAPGTASGWPADPFTNAVRITVSALRERLANPRSSPPWPASYRFDTNQTSDIDTRSACR